MGRKATALGLRDFGGKAGLGFSRRSAAPAGVGIDGGTCEGIQRPPRHHAVQTPAKFRVPGTSLAPCTGGGAPRALGAAGLIPYRGQRLRGWACWALRCGELRVWLWQREMGGTRRLKCVKMCLITRLALKQTWSTALCAGAPRSFCLARSSGFWRAAWRLFGAPSPNPGGTSPHARLVAARAKREHFGDEQAPTLLQNPPPRAAAELWDLFGAEFTVFADSPSLLGDGAVLSRRRGAARTEWSSPARHQCFEPEQCFEPGAFTAPPEPPPRRGAHQEARAGTRRNTRRRELLTPASAGSAARSSRPPAGRSCGAGRGFGAAPRAAARPGGAAGRSRRRRRPGLAARRWRARPGTGG